MYIRKSILFVLFVSVYQTRAKPRNDSCFECIHYSFEQDFESLFSTDNVCSGLHTWVEGKYATSNVAVPNDYSQSFISPQSELSCATSFPFTMAGGGTINVRVYMDSSDTGLLDQIYVLAEELTESGINPTMGMTVLSSTDLDFKNGWQTLTLTVFGSTIFTGQLIFFGLNTYRSVVIVDAFCYKPPNYEGECWVHDYLTTTTAEPETMVTETTTELVTYPATEVDPTTPEVTVSTSAPDIESTTSSVTNSTSVTEINSTTSVVTESTSAPDSESTTSTAVHTNPTTEQPANNVTSVPIVTNATTVSPPITPPTFPTQAPGVESRCPDDLFIHWLLPHEKKCNLFYYCVWGEKVLRECPEGLHFNPEIQVCDWPYNAGCKM